MPSERRELSLTKDFRETVVDRAAKDSVFRVGLLTEAVDCFLEGETDVAKSLFRDYINAIHFLNS